MWNRSSKNYYDIPLIESDEDIIREYRSRIEPEEENLFLPKRMYHETLFDFNFKRNHWVKSNTEKKANKKGTQ